MAQEINLGGTIYISSKKAAEMTGYTQDYVGQLARGGHIVAQRVSGLWYVVEQSLRDYKVKADEFKPEPPKFEPQQDLEASVSFDGKDYISAQRAAKITSYHQDYVGQLARSGKILSRQVGNRWYVDREGLVEHKKHNDALLAAVQTESVGLQKPIPQEKTEPKEDLHYSYTAQPMVSEIPLAPKSIVSEMPRGEENAIAIRREVPEPPREIPHIEPESPNDSEENAQFDRGINEIPIRVVKPRIVSTEMQEEVENSGPKTTQVVLYTIVAATVIVGGAAGFIYFSSRSTSPVDSNTSDSEETRTSVVPEFLLDLLGKELYYRRDSF